MKRHASVFSAELHVSSTVPQDQIEALKAARRKVKVNVQV
jgi:hypothetical protein